MMTVRGGRFAVPIGALIALAACDLALGLGDLKDRVSDGSIPQPTAPDADRVADARSTSQGRRDGAGGVDVARLFSYELRRFLLAGYCLRGRRADQGRHPVPTGDGRWGQADLGGNLSEWTMDVFTDPYANSCVDCLNVMGSGDRVYRGGAFWNADVSPATRQLSTPGVHDDHYGVRCARPL